MANCFRTDRVIHRRFDLKGSWVGRATKITKLDDPGVCLKDGDLNRLGWTVDVGSRPSRTAPRPAPSRYFFLAEQQIVDYSLLVGMHDLTPEDRQVRLKTAARRDRRKTLELQHRREVTARGGERASASTAAALTAEWSDPDSDEALGPEDLVDRPFFQKDEEGRLLGREAVVLLRCY